jgi:predicted dinucleotide-binding enzyme
LIRDKRGDEPEALVQIGVLGTGGVGQTVASAWSKAGHEVTLGSRDPGSKSFEVPVRPLADVVAGADVVVNATPGADSLDTLIAIGAPKFAGKVLIDVANANTPSFELVYPNSSLGEKLQDALPGAHVVKTMNTAAMTVLTDPASLGPSSVFLSGNDANAKATVAGLLADLGWAEDAIIDLGDITTARGVEHYFLLFAALMQAGGPNFNIRVVR